MTESSNGDKGALLYRLEGVGFQAGGRRIVGARGATAIDVLHDINMAARMCGRLLALRDGAILAACPPAKVMRGDVLAGIYGVGMGILEHPRTGAPIGYVE
ncbi:hypothetical protein [Chelativorans xinjiangense]|uniref:hypothetical protein n=1 Tax=Chelativorans xinjiangense TaxID=2681485 RepID=UPI00135A3D98|nr:hypothetical protein [Chelativorans xinjiangense]